MIRFRMTTTRFLTDEEYEYYKAFYSRQRDLLPIDWSELERTGKYRRTDRLRPDENVATDYELTRVDP